MNILYFTPNFPPQSEAAATRAYWFVKTLREAGHDVEVLTGQTTKTRLASNKDHPFKRLLWENILGIELFFKMLFSPRKMVILSSPPYFSVLWAACGCYLSRKKYILDVRDLYPEVFFETGLLKENTFFGSTLKSLSKYIYQNAETIVTVTEGLCNIIESYGVKRPTLIMNGYDSDIFFPGQPSEKFEKFTLIFHGNLGKVQNIQTLLKVAKQLAQYPDIQILVAGEGPKANEIASANLKNVTYLGNLSYEKIPELLRKCHVGLSFRTDDKIGREAFPVKVFEYMGTQIPTIMTPRGEAGNIIEGMNLGIQFENSQISEMVEAILRFKAIPPSISADTKKYSRAHQSGLMLNVLEEIRKRQKVAFLVVEDKAFLIQRLNLASFIKAQGYEVHVISNKSELSTEIEKLGFIYHDSRTKRRSMNPFNELISIFHLFLELQTIKPDIVHNVSIKPVIYGTLAARLAGVPKVINLINGLGFVFNEGAGWKRKILRNMVKTLYGLVLRSERVQIIFQNPDDKEFFESEGYVSKKRSHLILGSGVDTQKFSYKESPVDINLRFVFVSRMLWEKGIEYIIKAIEILKREGLDFEVWFVGEPDPFNPSSVKEVDLQYWQEKGLIKYLGFQKNIVEILHQTHVSILPTYYREGVPLSLIEAASTGNAIITTEMPGCKEIVKDGVNGILIPPKDEVALADAMRKMIKNHDLVKQMGEAGRARVEQQFSKEIVNQQTHQVYLL